MRNLLFKHHVGNQVKRFALFMVIVTTAVFSTSAIFAKNDLLHQEAKKSPMAASSFLMDIARAGNRLVAVGDRGHIVYSDDNGVSWTQADVPVSVLLTAVCFPSSQKGWAVGHEGVVLHTSDGGKTWVKQLDGFQSSAVDVAFYKDLVKEKEKELNLASDERKEALSGQLEDLKYQLENLQYEEEQGASKPFLDVWFDDDEHGYVVGVFGNIFHTIDGGTTWQSLRNLIHNPDTYHLKCIARAGDALIIAGEVGLLYRSMDNGQSWHALDSPSDASFFGLTASAHMIVATSFNGVAYLSRDLGESWTMLETGIKSTLADGTVLSDGSIAIVSYGGDILRIQNRTSEVSVQKVKYRGVASTAETEDGNLVVVGISGAHLLEPHGATEIASIGAGQ